METGTFERTLGRACRRSRRERHGQLPAGRPEGGPVAGAGAARPGPLSAGSPSAALKLADQTALPGSSARCPGQVQFVDNLSDSLNTAAGDSLYAQALYILLAVPGALVALGVAYLAALGTSERDRRDLALLRARGARRARPAGAGRGRERRDRHRRRARSGRARLRRGAAPVSGGAHLTTGRAMTPCSRASRLGDPRRGARRGSLPPSRCSRPRSPRDGAARSASARPPGGATTWTSLALALSGLIYWLTIRTGFSAVRQPRRQPDPVAVGLHVLRAGAALDRGDPAPGPAAGPLHGWPAAAARNRGPLASFLLAERRAPRRRLINRGLVVVGLLLAFGVSLRSSPPPTTSRPGSTPS